MLMIQYITNAYMINSNMPNACACRQPSVAGSLVHPLSSNQIRCFCTPFHIYLQNILSSHIVQEYPEGQAFA